MHPATPRAAAWIILVLVMLFSIAPFSVVSQISAVRPLPDHAKQATPAVLINPDMPRRVPFFKQHEPVLLESSLKK
tara:strand:+ start:2096 stop:2323 length:228 start_codon:yes stop_codon:yes gene_type:complete